MTLARCEVWLHLTAGQGPVECAWAVIKVLEKLREDAASAGLDARTLDLIPGPEAGTAHSALVALSGVVDLDSFVNAWRGTVQWIARSPFRPEHKRKNWFRGHRDIGAGRRDQFRSKRSSLGDHARERAGRAACKPN